MATDLDQKVDQLEAAVDPNTVISVGGYNFTPAKLMVAGAIVSSILGTLYGVFEVYKDYQDMKSAIQEYTAPDLSEIDKRIAVLEENSEKTVEFVRDINTNLRQDIRRVESVLEGVERSQRTAQREVDTAVRNVTQQTNKLERETAQELRNIRGEVDKKIQQALDNPLAN